MESFWLAETLKYLLLLFDDSVRTLLSSTWVPELSAFVPLSLELKFPHPPSMLFSLIWQGMLSLEKVVFNTEAHPFPVFNW